MRTWLKWLLKIVVTGLALYLTFRKIDWQHSSHLLLSANAWWLLLALLGYNVSQFISARRLQYFYEALSIPLSYLLNLRLYYKGMFYNLFLPGGIGGDGYKVHYLYRHYHKPVKKLATATLLDRLNGLVVLGFLIVLPASMGLVPAAALPFASWIPLAIYLAGTALYVFIIYFFLRIYFPVIHKATLMAVFVQGAQLLSVICIMQALHLGGPLIPFLLLFLASSIAAVIPFTIGGMGARELVFMSGATLLGVSGEQAVAVSLLFFLLTAVSSLCGAVVKVK